MVLVVVGFRRETQASFYLENIPAPPGNPNILRPERMYNPCSEFWVCLMVSSQWDSKVRHLNQRPEQTQLTPFGVKEQQLYSELLLTVAKADPGYSTEDHFSHLCLGSHWSWSNPHDHRWGFEDKPVNWELCHLTQFFTITDWTNALITEDEISICWSISHLSHHHLWRRIPKHYSYKRFCFFISIYPSVFPFSVVGGGADAFLQQ